MQHAWEGYENYAWGEDELAPKSKKGKDVWGTMGVTLVDSLGASKTVRRCLSTVYLMRHTTQDTSHRHPSSIGSVTELSLV